MRVLCLVLVYLVRSCSVVISGGVIFFFFRGNKEEVDLGNGWRGNCCQDVMY